MQTFATTAPITAVLDVPAGRVQVIASDQAEASVEVQPADASKGRDVKAAEQTTVDFADGVLRVQTEVKNKHLGSNGSVEVTVTLPAGSKVEGTSAATELRVVGRLGDLAYDGAYRNIKIDEAASLRLTATDGDVEVGRLNGSADISTQRGDIRITEATGGKVVLKTQSGDITVGAAAGVSASLNAGTTHGRVSNALKNDGAADLDIHATTSNGDITASSL
ncbi:DUF4097 family beta strand repeat protein [Actinomadura barringtoniae]|uniref:DUF4097 family beta strand repeat protein n=1 Tax=Actinomadura barringtoniae TaxID=1427535 RepID=A0A939PGU1_9ACTN|nr:DUF4097 family beta strand repeat-containing protein [Actinomadura barringtoniae]MBO2448954.1 DUF4097 family beta strand repeat protein [Actinomadura barringtoniae]